MDDTYEGLHAGDVVLGEDGGAWGVAMIVHVPQLAVTLVRDGVTVTGYPPLGTPVTVVQRTDLSAEYAPAAAFLAAFGAVEVLGEVWTE